MPPVLYGYQREPIARRSFDPDVRLCRESPDSAAAYPEKLWELDPLSILEVHSVALESKEEVDIRIMPRF